MNSNSTLTNRSDAWVIKQLLWVWLASLHVTLVDVGKPRIAPDNQLDKIRRRYGTPPSRGEIDSEAPLITNIPDLLFHTCQQCAVTVADYTCSHPCTGTGQPHGPPSNYPVLDRTLRSNDTHLEPHRRHRSYHSSQIGDHGSYKFEVKSHADRPTLASDNDHPMAYYCGRCERWFPNNRALEQHIENSNSHWLCDDCNIDFESDEALRQHYIQSPNHHYCGLCDRHFNFRKSRIQHMVDKHWYCGVHDKVIVASVFLALLLPSRLILRTYSPSNLEPASNRTLDRALITNFARSAGVILTI